MKLLYGTKNPAKLEVMRKRLRELDIEVIGFCSPEIKKLCEIIPDVPEEGNTPLENARQKAQTYYEIFKIPVFSCDSGLYIKELPDSLQPGIHVRTINGVYVFESMADSLASEPFLITTKPHTIRKKGFPLDSLSLEIEPGMYYYDKDPNKLNEIAVENGFLEFFKKCLL